MQRIFEDSIKFLRLHRNCLHKTRSYNFIGIFKVSAEKWHFGNNAEHVYHQINEIEEHLKTKLLGGVLLYFNEHLLRGYYFLKEVIVSSDAVIIKPLIATEHGTVRELLYHVVHIVAVHDELVSDGQLSHYFKPVLCFFSKRFG